MAWVTKTEPEIFQEVIGHILSEPPKALPPKTQKIGRSRGLWFESEPGTAVILTSGGSSDDRWFAEFVLREQLRACGLRQARFEFDPSPEFIKTAEWKDIEAKAKRLIQENRVQLLRNGANNVVAYVQGDHGNYQSEFSRDDPQSRVITQWTCECPWDQYAFQRTRQWKKYEARVCSHVLAAIWKSQSTPVDEEIHPNNQPSLPGMPTPGGPGGGLPSVIQPRQPTPIGPPAPPGGQQLSLPGMGGPAPGAPGPAAPPIPGGVPTDPGIIPSFPPGGEPPVPPPVSVPGLRPPTPYNPVQYPGGTYSDWHLVDEWDLNDAERIAAKGDTFENSDMVQFTQEEMGIAEGRSVPHGAGQYRTIPRNSIGQVLGQDPTTGWVEVIIPIHDAGPMEPELIRGFFDPAILVPRSDIRQPGGFIKRR